jgi:hypothetical protein
VSEESEKSGELEELKRLLKERAKIKAKIESIDASIQRATEEGVRRVRLKSEIAETERESFSLSEVSKIRSIYEGELAAIARRIKSLSGEPEIRQHRMRLV